MFRSHRDYQMTSKDAPVDCYRESMFNPEGLRHVKRDTYHDIRVIVYEYNCLVTTNDILSQVHCDLICAPELLKKTKGVLRPVTRSSLITPSSFQLKEICPPPRKRAPRTLPGRQLLGIAGPRITV